MITIDTIHKYGAEDSGQKIVITSLQRKSYQNSADQEAEWVLSGISPELEAEVSPLIERMDNLPKEVLEQLLGGRSALEKVLGFSDVQASLLNVTKEKINNGSVEDLRTYLNQIQGFKTKINNEGAVSKFLESIVSDVDDKLERIIAQKKEEQEKQNQQKKEAEIVKKEKEKEEQEAKEAEEAEKAKEKQSENQQSNDGQGVASNFAPSSSVTNLGADNVSVPETNYSSGNTYVWGNCTWGVKSYFGSRVGDYWGNGQEWAPNAKNAGFVVDDNPVPWNTVAVFSGGLYGSSSQYGHVAVVASVKDNQVEVYEMNVAGLGAYSYRWVPKEGLQFIHV